MNEENALASLESRVAKLERRNRFLSTCLGAALAIGVFTAAKTASQPASFSEVRAHRFVLMDDGGKEVGLWSVADGKSPSLVMGSSDLKRIELYEYVNGKEVFGNLLLRGSREQEVYVNTSINGPVISLYGRNEIRTRRSLAKISSDTNGEIALRNGLGTYLRLSSSEHPSTPAIEYNWRDRKAGQWSFTMYDVTFNGAKLHLNNREGSPILTLPQGFTSKSVQSPQQKRFPLFGPRRP